MKFKWIEIFEQTKPKPKKTKIFIVRNKEYGTELAIIKWNGGYRKYALYPLIETWFEEECLKEIAKFLEKISKEHKENNKLQKEQK